MGAYSRGVRILAAHTAWNRSNLRCAQSAIGLATENEKNKTIKTENENNMKTVNEIKQMVCDGRLTEHHTASCRGYVSRKIDGVVRRYSGRYGTGWTVETPRWDSTRFCHITYYIDDLPKQISA